MPSFNRLLPLFATFTLAGCFEQSSSNDEAESLSAPAFVSIHSQIETQSLPHTLDFNWLLSQGHGGQVYSVYVNGQASALLPLPQANLVSDYQVYQSQIQLNQYAPHSVSIKVCTDKNAQLCSQSETRIVTVSLPSEPQENEQHNHDHDMNTDPNMDSTGPNLDTAMDDDSVTQDTVNDDGGTDDAPSEDPSADDSSSEDTATDHSSSDDDAAQDAGNEQDTAEDNSSDSSSSDANSDSDISTDESSDTDAQLSDSDDANHDDVVQPDEDMVVEEAEKLNSEPLVFYSAWNKEYCLAANGQQLTLQHCNDQTDQLWQFVESKLVWQGNRELCADMSQAQVAQAVALNSCELASQWEYAELGYLLSNNLTLDVNRSEHSVIAYGFHGGTNQQWSNEAPPQNHSSDSEWAQVNVASDENYGTRHFVLPAAQNWANTGLFLSQGQQAHIRASGQWRVKDSASYDANGHPSRTSRGCAEGELVARIGLYYKDAAITCIGDDGTITAHADGIVYVGAVVSNDLGETYEARADASGALDVTVSAQGAKTVPTISYLEAGQYDFNRVTSGWVEVRGEHNILTLPVATAAQDADELFAAVKRLDDIYKLHTQLRGKQPYHGQPVRWFPDTEDAPGWMLAGNPVRMDPALVAKSGGSRISIAGRDGQSNWGFAHELGHNFNFAGGTWYYTTSGGLEAWPNIFSLHAYENLGLSADTLDQCAQKKTAYLNKNAHDDALGGAGTGICFLMEFTEQYGWQVWKDFYAEFDLSPTNGWQNMKNRMDKVTGENTKDIFSSWNIAVQ